MFQRAELLKAIDRGTRDYEAELHNIDSNNCKDDGDEIADHNDIKHT